MVYVKIAMFLATPVIFCLLSEFVTTKLWGKPVVTEDEESSKKKRSKAVDKLVNSQPAVAARQSASEQEEEFQQVNPLVRERRRKQQTVAPEGFATAEDFAPPAGFDFRSMRDA